MTTISMIDCQLRPRERRRCFWEGDTGGGGGGGGGIRRICWVGATSAGD
jgi:hypothetical protein